MRNRKAGALRQRGDCSCSVGSRSHYTIREYVDIPTAALQLHVPVRASMASGSPLPDIPLEIFVSALRATVARLTVAVLRREEWEIAVLRQELPTTEIYRRRSFAGVGFRREHAARIDPIDRVTPNVLIWLIRQTYGRIN
jgi:hypothetical protein